MKIKHSVLIGFITLLFAISASAYQTQPEETSSELTITDFTNGESSGFTTTAAGLTMEYEADTAVYTSPEIQTNIPFNAIVPNWISDLPHEAEIGLMLRTRPHNGTWTEWQIIDTHADWNDESEAISFGEMVFTPNAEQLHTHLQYSVSLAQQDQSTPPTISQIGFTLINSTAGPTTEELIAQQTALDAMSGYQKNNGANPRPTMISRELWCLDPACDYTEDLEYVPASHLIVHHTVSSNNGSNYDWASVMRAIWHYHTYTLGWGDIGYNYLIDINGVIYEGHMNEDYDNLDVVGIHASGANAGSMAVSLMGNFVADTQGITPSQQMLNSLTDVMAWKATQHNINVYDAGNDLPNINWGLPYLMGHRDVYGTTECPGEQMHILLPWLRDQVATRIGLVDPYLYVQELDAEFTKSSTNFANTNYNCGHNLHAYYTWSTESVYSYFKWGEWEINVPENGRYRIDAHIPYCYTGRPETNGASYTINHANGSSQVVLSQNDNVGMWTELGEFELDTEGDYSVYLSNLTTTDSGLGVWFDSIRLIRVDETPEPPQTINNISPTNDATITNPAAETPPIEFSWMISATYPISNTTFQISTNDTFTTTMYEASWQTAVSTTTHTIATEGNYFWKVEAILNKGDGITETISSQPTLFTIEPDSPTNNQTSSSITNQMPTDSYLTNQPNIDFGWTISNSYSVLSTTFQMSTDNTFMITTHQATWSGAVTTTTHTLSQDGTYFWRSEAILDLENNSTEIVYSAPTTLILDTAVPTSTLTVYQIPDGNYPISWSGSDATSGIANYNVFYRQQGEMDWTPWFTETSQTDALFTPPNPAEIYEFNIQATDNAGNQQPLPALPSSSTDQAILLSHAIMLPMVTRH